jgi:hypothetical protein
MGSFRGNRSCDTGVRHDVAGDVWPAAATAQAKYIVSSNTAFKLTPAFGHFVFWGAAGLKRRSVSVQLPWTASEEAALPRLRGNAA